MATSVRIRKPAPRLAGGSSANPAQLTAAVFLAAIAAVFVYAAAAASDDRPRAVVWGGMAFGTFALALLFAGAPRQQAGLGLAAWKLGPWMLAWYSAAFGFATVTWIQPQTGAPAEIALSSVLRALWLTGCGMALWFAGYCTSPGEPLRRHGKRVMAGLGRRFSPDVRSLAAPWILYAIGAAGRFASASLTGRFGYSGTSAASGYGQFLAALGLCAPLGVGAAALQVLREGIRQARVTLAVLVLAELATGAASGGKQSYVITVLAVAIPYSIIRRRLPVKSLTACVLVFLAVVIPFNRAYRGVIRDGSSVLSPSQAVSAAPGVFRQAILAQDPLTLVPGSMNYLLQRIRETDSPAIIVQRSPSQIPFMSPWQLVAAPIAGVIPRALWAGKPVMEPGVQVSEEYYGLGAGASGTSSAVTPVADLYRHGGWVPVIAGMLLLGIGVRFLDDVLDADSPHAFFLVLLLFPVLVKGETDWITLLAGIPSTLAVWWLSITLVFGHVRRSA